VEGSSKDMRASDADRQQLVDRLEAAFGEGRLRIAEYESRVAAAYQAETYGDLYLLGADLPSVPPAYGGSRPVRDQAPPPYRMPGALRFLWGLLLLGVAVNVVVYLLVVFTTTGPVYPWPLWVAGPAGAALGVLTLVTRPQRPRLK
jgi:hypothetical protein